MAAGKTKEGEMRRAATALVCGIVVLVGGCFLFQTGILYEETWSDPDATEWTIGDSETATKSIESGRYYVLLKKTTTVFYWNDDTETFGDAQYDLDVKHLQGTNTGSAGGLLFRVTDVSNSYGFQVSAYGSFRVVKWVGGVRTVLVAWTASDAVNKDVAENHLTVLADGSSLTFLINGTEVAEITDDSFSTGYVGVNVSSLTEGNIVEQSFDNLVVRELE